MSNKMKTKRALAKRFKVTASGKVVRFSQNHNHLAHNKTQNQKRRLRKATLMSRADERRLKRLITK